MPSTRPATRPAPRTAPGTVLVTGASSGIGRATARLFAHRGVRVFGTSRKALPDRREGDQGGVEMLRLDIRSPESVRRCVDQVHDRSGGIDVLVNNAGVMCEGFAEETDLADAQALFATNFFGTVRMIHAVLPGMRARRSGRIINIGSLAAWVGEPGEAFYAASKAALARYTESLRHEVWHLGIQVTLLEPGAYATGILPTTGDQTTITDYDGPRENAHRTLHHALRTGDDPAKAAEMVWRIAATSTPHGRSATGPGSSWIPHLKTLLPQRLFDTLLRRSYHLPR